MSEHGLSHVSADSVRQCAASLACRHSPTGGTSTAALRSDLPSALLRMVLRRLPNGAAKPMLYAVDASGIAAIGSLPHNVAQSTNLRIRQGDANVKILVTGGAGYIGSHAVRLLEQRRPRGLGLRQPVARPSRRGAARAG